jgi:hypothetical protein
MATFAALDHRIEVNSVVLSGWTNQVTLPIQFDALEDTAFGDTARSRLAGLQDSTLGLGLNQDFASGAVDATIGVARGTVVAVKVRPTSSSISATNPEYVGSYLISDYSPFSNSVGALAQTNTSWPLADPDGIARNTS